MDVRNTVERAIVGRTAVIGTGGSVTTRLSLHRRQKCQAVSRIKIRAWSSIIGTHQKDVRQQTPRSGLRMLRTFR